MPLVFLMFLCALFPELTEVLYHWRCVLGIEKNRVGHQCRYEVRVAVGCWTAILEVALFVYEHACRNANRVNSAA